MKDEIISFKVSKEQKELIAKYAAKYNTSISTFIINCILYYLIKIEKIQNATMIFNK